jgi:hypothetical protein
VSKRRTCIATLGFSFRTIKKLTDEIIKQALRKERIRGIDKLKIKIDKIEPNAAPTRSEA